MFKKNYISTRSTMATCVLLLAIGLVGSPALAATCSYANLNGVFGYVHGRPGALATVVVGQLTLDGNGNVTSASWTESEIGSIKTGTTTGTYTISPSCSGTLTLTDEDIGLSHFDIYLNLGNKMFQMIQTDSGSNQPGFGQAEGTVTCGVPGKEVFLTTNLLGLVNSLPAETVGAVTLDGDGNISGTETFTTNGVVDTLSVTGTYTENSDCTGTWEITPTGGTPVTFNTVIVNGGNEFLLIQTNTGAITTGSAQTSATL